MVTSTPNILPPEVHELHQKLAALAEMEDELSERELDLATLQAQLLAFQQRYLRIVATRYARLDEINAQVAEAQARLCPDDAQAQEEAEEARLQARESTEAAAEAATADLPKFKPSDDLKKIYREIALQLHPDLATDDLERTQRHHLMVEVNRAYENGDGERLQQILREWRSSPDAVRDEGIGAELIRAIRKIAQVEGRLSTIEEAIVSLMESELHQLFRKTEEAELEGRDLLAEIAHEIDEEIARAKIARYDVLAQLVRELDFKIPGSPT